MGVPALFRWLSKKYPKIIYPVIEEEDKKVANQSGEEVPIPFNMSMPNPNSVEFDNLYLDMNGIVHPCTHPEGKPAPETEEEMMVEVFKYTERVVNMVRPRKLLFMAIDGVAPRAKMNQQRSRRFRSAQEAREKEEARQESLLLWKAMGKEVSDTEQNKAAWDSNAITPGTPFMDLLASSLRYWVVQKMNTDPGWKNIQVLISDATVPGEGEHKIMDFIRRQRSNPGHDPNTRHVIYGLDADLIMLSLATHEPHFRVLREDVFANDTKPTACRICGQEGHYAAQCTGTKAEIQKPPSDKKPFIFLDISILREYLEVELDVPNIPFPFSLEHAIDDWVLLIFFVGNDFLPHLPSLEIREGAIDTLLRIWKTELARMGGYMTNHGHLELSRAQIILEGLARREDEIFRRRREAEERQEQNAKRRKVEKENGHANFSVGPSQVLALTTLPTAPTTPAPPPLHPSLPKRPTYDFTANADSIGLGAKPTAESLANLSTAAQALAGSNRDVVANRRAIRLANMSAAEVLKAELAGLSPVKPSAKSPPKPAFLPPKPQPLQVIRDPDETTLHPIPPPHIDQNLSAPMTTEPRPPATPSLPEDGLDADGDGDPDPDLTLDDSGADHQVDDAVAENLAGAKRKFDEGPGEPGATEEDVISIDDDDDDGDGVTPSLALKVNPDGTVEQQDVVKLWEPGYKERYYRHKFGVELSDVEFRQRVTKCYVEGLCWVLHYYYQGTPSWNWYYPYHFSPFAADFEEIDKMDIKFDLGAPFKPFEQLMGVFPAASRQHIPKQFQHLMIDEDSPIIDFYPSTFEIDMNGKKLAWQGVALLPFIDEKRLLDAMAPEYPKLTDEELRRNHPGANVIFASVDHPLYPFYEALYGKRKNPEPVSIDSRMSHGMSGTVLPNPECIPGSTYYSVLSEVGLSDIKNDQSLSILYFFPPQSTPHRSVILPGTKRPPRVLSPSDLEAARRGGRPNRGNWDNNGPRGNGMDRSRNDPFHSRPGNYYPSQMSYGYGNERNGGNRNRGDFFGGVYGGGEYTSRGGSSYQSSYPPRPSYPSQAPSHNSYTNTGGYGSQGSGYGGHPYPRNINSSGYSAYGSGNRHPDSSYSSYRSNTGNSSYGGYGGYGGGSNSGGGHGAYGSYGGHPTQPNYSSRGTNPRGRGRGR